jgi:predicted enzyme related to lactoylglutathione lyase
MPTRENVPLGAPCWIDLITSDVDRARHFYGELFGWQAEDPNESFGGYFNFAKDGVHVAGAMAHQPQIPAADVWSVYLATDDAQKTAEAAASNGGAVFAPPMQLEDLGTMAVVSDVGGASIGMWQAGVHKGIGVYGEPGTPSWFEVHTRDFAGSLAFYRDVFGWTTETVGDTDDFRYAVLTKDGDQLAGIMDASAFLPADAPACWSVYFAVADTDAAIAVLEKLGGSVVQPAEDTPYGRIAQVADPMGAPFKLLGPNAATSA